MRSTFESRFTRWSSVIALAGLVSLVASASVSAAPRESNEVVKATAKAGKIEKGKQTITVTVVIEKGWHIYANPVGLKDLDSVKTKVALVSPKEAKLAKVSYPQGKLQKDDIVGDYRVYENVVSFEAKVERKKGDEEPIELTVQVQACDDRRCLLPSKLKVTAK